MPAIDQLLHQAMSQAAEADRYLQSKGLSGAESFSETIRQLAAMIKDQTAKTQELENRCQLLEKKMADGGVQSGSPLSEDGFYAGYINVLKDITQIKRYGEKLEKQKLILEESQRLAHIGSWEVDLATNAVTSSDEIYRIFGIDPNLSRPPIEFLNTMVHPDDLARRQAHHAETIKTRIFKDLEFRILRPDGTPRLVHASGTVFCDAKGAPTHVIGCMQDITESRHKEQSLRMFKFCVDQAPDAIFWIKRDAGFSYVNEKACQLFGYSSQELSQMSLPDIIPVFNKERWDIRWEHYQKGGPVDAIQNEAINRCKDGRLFPAENSAKHVWISDKAFHVSFVRDISDRKAVEQKLKIAQHTIDQAAIGCVWLDQDCVFTYANEQACRALGYSREELYGMAMVDVDFRISREDGNRLWQSLCDNGSISYNTEYKRKDGSSFPVENSSTLVEYEGGRFCASFFQDITQRKQVEEALRLTQFCFEKAAIGIYLIDSNGRIMMVNEHVCANMGYTQDELRTMSIFDISPNMNRNMWVGHRKRLGKIHSYVASTDHQRKNGTTFPVEVLINSMEFENDHIAISFVSDITERKQAQEQKALLEARLVQMQKMEAIGSLAGGIAHDFNNILAGILGYAELAHLSSPENSPVQRYIDQLCIACDRAKNLVQQIMIFSRQNKVDKEPIDMSVVVNEALKLIRASIPASVDIRQNVKNNLGAVLANQTQIHQVIMNLCTNAYHALKNDIGANDHSLLLIDVGLDSAIISEADTATHPDITPGQYLKLTVQDTGHGMDAETLTHIFEPYFTTKRAEGGSGLGLSTVHGLVMDHDGAIKVYSEPGKGTVFHIWLPVVENNVEKKSISADSFPAGNENILLVDDEISLIEIHKDLLENFGYTVETMGSAQAALEVFSAEPEKFDLLITDMSMPQMTGEKLAREIKKIRPDLPVILCTGFSDKVMNQSIKDLGVDALLIKPVTALHFANTVRRMLDGG